MFIAAIADPAEICVPVIVTACGAAWFAATTPATSAGGTVAVGVGVVLELPHAVSVMVITQPARIAITASSVNSRRPIAESGGVEGEAVNMRTPLRCVDDGATALSQNRSRPDRRGRVFKASQSSGPIKSMKRLVG